MDILEFRESYINEDINAEAVNTSRYPVEVFIDNIMTGLVGVGQPTWNLVSNIILVF